MATVTVSLPEPMKDWVEAQARAGRYGDAGEYVRDLIRRDQERAALLDDLQALVDEGIRSGIGDRTPDDIRRLGRDKLAAGTSDGFQRSPRASTAPV